MRNNSKLVILAALMIGFIFVIPCAGETYKLKGNIKFKHFSDTGLKDPGSGEICFPKDTLVELVKPAATKDDIANIAKEWADRISQSNVKDPDAKGVLGVIAESVTQYQKDAAGKAAEILEAKRNIEKAVRTFLDAVNTDDQKTIAGTITADLSKRLAGIPSVRDALSGIKGTKKIQFVRIRFGTESNDVIGVNVTVLITAADGKEEQKSIMMSVTRNGKTYTVGAK